MTAFSGLYFDFDDIVVGSAAYRQAMKNNASSNLRQDKAHEDIMGRNEGITADTHRDRPSEKDERHGRNHGRQKSQTKYHTPNLRRDEAHKEAIEGKEEIAINTRRGPIGEREGHRHERQNIQPNMLRPKEFQIRKLPNKSRFGSDVRNPWRATKTSSDPDVQAPWEVTLISRKDGCRQEQEDEAYDDLIPSSNDATMCQSAEEYRLDSSATEAPIVEQVHVKDVSQSLTSTKDLGALSVSRMLLPSSPQVEEDIGVVTEHKVVRRNQNYHRPYFTCSVCSQVFGPNDTYYRHAGEIFCFRHYAAPCCQGCGMPIFSTPFYIDYDSRQNPWHRECFKAYSYRDIASKTRDAIKRIGDKGYDSDNDELSAEESVAMVSAMKETIIAIQAELRTLRGSVVESPSNGAT
jgi:hypothetical protein